jgi:hypothetical protein
MPAFPIGGGGPARAPDDRDKTLASQVLLKQYVAAEAVPLESPPGARLDYPLESAPHIIPGSKGRFGCGFSRM